MTPAAHRLLCSACLSCVLSPFPPLHRCVGCVICLFLSPNIGIQFPSVAWRRSSDETPLGSLSPTCRPPVERLSPCFQDEWRTFSKNAPMSPRGSLPVFPGLTFSLIVMPGTRRRAFVPPPHSAAGGPDRNLLLKGRRSVLAGCCTLAAFDWLILYLFHEPVALSGIIPVFLFFILLFIDVSRVFLVSLGTVTTAAPRDGFGFWKLIGRQVGGSQSEEALRLLSPPRGVYPLYTAGRSDSL